MKKLCKTSYTKKPQIQYGITIESCIVHKFNEKSIFQPNKQLKFTKTTTKQLKNV